MIPYARRSREGDASTLAPRLRDVDLREIKAASGHTPLAVLQSSLRNSSQCYSGVVQDDDDVVMMFGVVPWSVNTGAVWLLTSDIDKLDRSVAFKFARDCKKWADELSKECPILFNWVDARNTTAIRWLKWMGFEFPTPAKPYGVEQRPFFQFQRIAHVWTTNHRQLGVPGG